MPKKSKDTIEESPLLSNSSSSRDKVSSRAHSTIHPERFDMARFSERRDEEENSFRIIIYVIVVIAIGVGLALLVRYLISNNSGDDSNEDTQETVESAYVINTTAKADSLAVNAPADSDFVTDETAELGSTDSTATMNVSQVKIDRYTTFARAEFLIEGIESQEDLSLVSMTFDNSNLLSIEFDADVTVAEGLQGSENVGSIIDTISYNQLSNSFNIALTSDGEYRPLVTNTGFFVDFRLVETETVETPDEEETEEPVVETPETTDPNRPSGLNTTNNFSQEKQFVTSNVSTNSIGQNIFYYEDTVDYFEFAWGALNNVGNDYIPNATAELVTEGGKSYIDVTIENLSEEVFENYNITGTGLTESGIDLSAANFVRIDRLSFSGGTAKYRLELKRAADFRLISEPTVDGSTQVLALQIKD